MPPAFAECVQTVIGPYAGAIPSSNAINQFRGVAGQMRIDMGAISLITDPKTGERILLNHLLLEARILVPAVPGGLTAVPGAPPMPSIKMALAIGLAMLPSAAAASALQLGRSYIQGHEVEGMRYVFPAMPGAPVPAVSVWEIWNSVKLRLPVMTQTTGSFGQSTCMCRVTGVTPPPTTFQIPPGYRVVQPPMPGVPAVPNVPGAPSLPNVPSLPNAPSIATPSAPGIPSLQPPGVPNMPSIPSAPNVPTLPSVSSMPSPPNLPSIPNAPSIPSAPSIPPASSVPSVAIPQPPAIPSATPPPLPPFKIPGR